MARGVVVALIASLMVTVSTLASEPAAAASSGDCAVPELIGTAVDATEWMGNIEIIGDTMLFGSPLTSYRPDGSVIRTFPELATNVIAVDVDEERFLTHTDAGEHVFYWSLDGIQIADLGVGTTSAGFGDSIFITRMQNPNDRFDTYYNIYNKQDASLRVEIDRDMWGDTYGGLSFLVGDTSYWRPGDRDIAMLDRDGQLLKRIDDVADSLWRVGDYVWARDKSNDQVRIYDLQLNEVRVIDGRLLSVSANEKRAVLVRGEYVYVITDSDGELIAETQRFDDASARGAHLGEAHLYLSDSSGDFRVIDGAGAVVTTLDTSGYEWGQFKAGAAVFMEHRTDGSGYSVLVAVGPNLIGNLEMPDAQIDWGAPFQGGAIAVSDDYLLLATRPTSGGSYLVGLNIYDLSMCPQSEGSFVDDDVSTFQADIEWLAGAGITSGCNPPINDMFCPSSPVTRGQMAAFLHRALPDLPVGSARSFVDDDGSVFEDDIEWLASVGVTVGCNPPINDMFCPSSPVTRGQMAAFLHRALPDLPVGSARSFVDDDGSVFEDDIEWLASVGVTVGCNPPDFDEFCPSSPVTRGQMAAFLHRALGE